VRETVSAPSGRTPRIAVCAPGEASDEELLLAGAIGRLVAERGCTLVCGGLGGAMAAACRGAQEAGGVTIGIIPGYDDRAANPWVEHVICTGIGQARNALVAATGQALIAVGGGWGTLSEIALGLRLGRPVVLVGGWANLLAAEEVRARLGDLEGTIIIAETPEAAVDAAIAALSPPQLGDGRWVAGCRGVRENDAPITLPPRHRERSEQPPYDHERSK
jgi:uncharacterized protein (TIGR00725 family)